MIALYVQRQVFDAICLISCYRISTTIKYTKVNCCMLDSSLQGVVITW